MADNAPAEITIAPHESGSSAPLTHADTFAARAKAALADADSYFLDGLALLDSDDDQSETRAPATPTGEKPAPTTQTASTAAESAAHGPGTDQDGERPAAAAPGTTQPTEGESPTADGQPDPRTENNRRRAESQQAILLREKTALEARLAALEEQNRQLLFDNKVLFGQHETVRETARKQGAVRYEDVDQALTDAATQQHQLRQAEEMQRAQERQAVQQQSAGWQAAIGERVAFGKTARGDAINAILEAAIETKQEITVAKAEEMVVEGYNDPAVLAQINLWRSDRVPTDLANQQIAMAFQFIAQRAKQKLVQQAVDAIKGEQMGLGEYNRDQAYGVANAARPGQYGGRPLTYQQRAAADVAAASEMFDNDLRRLTGD